MKDYYREVLGTDAKNIWKRQKRLSYEYLKMNVIPNLKLDNVRKELFSGNPETALNDVKIDLARFGKNWFLSAIYHPLETGDLLAIVPSKDFPFMEKEQIKNISFKEYLLKSFYSANFMKMREKQLKGKAYEAKTIRSNILNENFFENFLEYTEEYLKSKKKKGKVQKLKNEVMEYAEYAKLTFPSNAMLLLNLYVLAENKSTIVCPYQRTRYYSEMIAEKADKRSFDDNELLSSSPYKNYFLSNFGIDRCTSKELEVFNAAKNDEKKFRKISTTWNSALVKIEK